MTPQSFVPSTPELLSHNTVFAAQFDQIHRQVNPSRRLVIVTCMDSRMDIFQILGLENGEAHIIRNAGGVVTDDVVRSLCLSQRKMGTREVILMHHTDCGLQDIVEDEFRSRIEAEIGVRPWWALESFSDPYADVRQSIQRLYMTPFLLYKEHVRGFVYDVDTGLLHEVELSHR